MSIQVPRDIAINKPEDQGAFNTEVILAFRALAKAPFIEYRIIDVAVTTSATRVTHMLGYQARWVIVDKDADARVWRVAGSPVDVAKYLYLQASVAVNVKVLVF